MASLSRRRIGAYFFGLGASGFGGPVVLVERMHRELVEERGWISEAEYRDGVALAQIAPGPLAAQLCFYLGWVRGGLAGAVLSGTAFVLPSFGIVLGLGWAYLRFGGLPWMQAAFYGVGAAVIGLIARSALRLAGKTLARDPLGWAIFLPIGAVTALTGREPVGLILLAAVLAIVVRAPPAWLTGSGLVREAGSVLLLLQLFGFFAYAGSFVFGSGLAIVPFLHGGLVRERHWLTEPQFLDAVAVALITPGPVVITVAFVGYLLAGIPGAMVAAVGTFLPCFLLTVIPARLFQRHAAHPRVRAAAFGLTAAATGALAGAVIVLARRTISDLVTADIALAAFTVCTLFRRAPEPLIVLVAGLFGLLI